VPVGSQPARLTSGSNPTFDATQSNISDRNFPSPITPSAQLENHGLARVFLCRRRLSWDWRCIRRAAGSPGVRPTLLGCRPDATPLVRRAGHAR